jgi:hypothetical protein
MDRKIKYFTDDETKVGVYNVVVTAAVTSNHQAGGFTKTQTIKLTVQNGCATDNINFATAITDFNYYLGVNSDATNNW